MPVMEGETLLDIMQDEYPDLAAIMFTGDRNITIRRNSVLRTHPNLLTILTKQNDFEELGNVVEYEFGSADSVDEAMGAKRYVERILMDGLEIGRESAIDLRTSSLSGLRIQTGNDPQEDIILSIDLTHQKDGFVIVEDLAAEPFDPVFIAEYSPAADHDEEREWFNGGIVIGNDMGKLQARIVPGDDEPVDFEAMIAIDYRKGKLIIRNRGVIMPFQVHSIARSAGRTLADDKFESEMPIWEMAMAADPQQTRSARELLEQALAQQKEALARARLAGDQAEIKIYTENIAHLERNIRDLKASAGEPAMSAPGGIDLDPALLDLQIKYDDNGTLLPMSEQPIMNMKIEGFIPVIIHITPLHQLPHVFGRQTGETHPFSRSKV
jgi:hypothetical protein